MTELRPQIFQLLSTMIILLPVVFSSPCDFGLTHESKWHLCDCQPVGTQSGRVFCRHMWWLTIPPLPPSNISHPYLMTSLSVVQSGLLFVNQDAFQGHNIQLIDLNNNQIETINVNAFRGLESKLYQLSLNYNSLRLVPSKALTYMYQLQYLHLKHNQIRTVDAQTFAETQLKSLRFLHMDHNHLKIIPEASFSRVPLNLLSISNNRIELIENQSLPSSLWYLNLKQNMLRSIPFGALMELSQLAKLNLAGNNITDIHVAPKLRLSQKLQLDLSNNRIQKLRAACFSNFAHLELLDLSYNQISTIDPSAFEGIKTFKKVDLSHNRIAVIPPDVFLAISAGIIELSLEDNDLHTLPTALRHLKSLEKLNLNSNKLTDLANETLDSMKPQLMELNLGYNSLSSVPTRQLDGMKKLKILNLSKNQIKKLPRLAFGKLDGAGTSLVQLNLAGNLIESIDDPGAFLYMSALAYLDLSSNRIAHLADDVFSRLAGLESLFLPNNNLNSFPYKALNGMGKLRYLVLDSSKMMALPSDSLLGLKQLHSLSISHSQLQAVQLDSLPSKVLQNLRSLNLAHNHIVYLSPKSVQNLSNLEVVDLQHNYIYLIHSYSFHNVPNLKRIDLSYNEITKIYNQAIDNAPRLIWLSLSHNNLSELDHLAFAATPGIQILKLDHNIFDKFDFSKFQFRNLEILDLSYNRLKEFNIRSFRDHLRDLNLEGNKIQVLPAHSISAMPQLRKINLSKNGLLNLHHKAFQGSPKLTILDLSHNYISKIGPGTFVHQEIYTKINLDGNSLLQLENDIFGMDNLYELSLRKNRLRTVPYTALNSVRGSLSHLDLSHNSISLLESTFFDSLANLSTLILSNNAVKRIEGSAFGGLHMLRHLDLSQNPVNSWHPQAFQRLSHTIDTVSVADTGLLSVPNMGMRGIRHLNLSGNNIYELQLDDLNKLERLRTLDLSYNRLSELSDEILHSLSDLRSLNLSHNPIRVLTSSHFESLTRLDTLRLHNMDSLRTLPTPASFSHLRDLRHLQVYNLGSVANINASMIVSYLPPLRSLHIEIKEDHLANQLDKADMRQLRELAIYGHKLKSLSLKPFQKLRGYNVLLKISGTSLKSLPDGFFDTLTGVQILRLDMNNNQLTSLNPFQHTSPPAVNLHATQLISLQMKHNNLICDCRLSWVSEYLRNLNTLQPEYFEPQSSSFNSTYCTIPDYSRRTPLLDVNFDTMGCYASTLKTTLSLLVLNFSVVIMSLMDSLNAELVDK